MMSRAQIWYRTLLRLYPAEFRARYGRAITDFHRDRVAAARAGGEPNWLLWTRLTLDVLASAAAEHAHSITRDEAVIPTILHDCAYAARGLLRRPGFAVIVILTMALGIGANAAIFTVVNGVLLQPLPYPHSEQLVNFGHEPPQWLTSEPDFLDYHRELTAFSGLAAYTRREATLTSGNDPERVRAVAASEDFFPLLEVKPAVGRTFSSDEFAVRPAPVVILSYALWQRRFGGERSIIGQRVSIEGIPRTIVGIMPPRFAFPEARTDVWLPLPRFNPDSLNDRDNHYLFMVGRLKPDVKLATAFVEANGLAKRFMHEFPNLYNPREPLTPHITFVEDDLVGGTRPYLFALLSAVGFVLLIACANVANLLLVRSETRHKEMAVRSALGASRFRLITQLLTESTMLAALGGGLALVIAAAGDRVLVALAPASIPRLDEIRVDWRVVAFTALVTAATGIFVGLVPGLRASRDHSADALKDAGRLTTTQGVARGARRLLVVAELMLAVVTLAGTAMLVRSLWNLQRAELGFDPAQRLTATVALPVRQYDDAHARLFYEQLLTRIRALPGVSSAAATGWLPIVDVGGLWGVRPEGRDFAPGQSPEATPQWATPGYFRTMGIPILAGREFEPADQPETTPVIIVSKRLADRFWPNENALGRRVRLGNPTAPWLTVVGVVGDIRSHGFAEPPEPMMYFAYAQSAKTSYYQPSAMGLILRTNGDPSLLATPLRQVVQGLDPMVPVSEVRTMDQITGTSVANRRFSTALLAGFAALALLLAGIGTYGVIAYGVTQRSFEIGVRIALGAGERSVLALVLSEAMRLCAIGIVLGLVGSAVVGRGLRALLVGVSPVDLPALLIASAALMVVALLACLVPARRALAIDPIAVMRAES
jgi:putative ABC transport system permease protein